MQLLAGAPSLRPKVGSEVTTEVVLQMYVGLGIAALAVTFTVIVHMLPALTVAPDKAMLFEPGTAVVVPGGVQPSTSPLSGLATVKPVGSVSVNEIFVICRVTFGLLSMNCNATVPPGRTLCDKKFFFKTGGKLLSDLTVIVPLEGVPLPPLLDPGVMVFT